MTAKVTNTTQWVADRIYKKQAQTTNPSSTTSIDQIKFYLANLEI